MRRFYDYLLMSQLLRRARFLLPLLVLAALVSFSVTTSSVQSTAEVNRETEKVLPQRQPAPSATPTTAEVCQETQKVLDQMKRELQELKQTRRFKERESGYRDSLSTLNVAIANGSLLDMYELEFLLANVPVEAPKNSNGGEKSAAELTPQERSALQRTLRSVLLRELEKAVNTTFDRLEDRIAKNESQLRIRQQRMEDLDCANLKDETVESGKTPDITGTWVYERDKSFVYNISQKGTDFSWMMGKYNQKGEGTITGNSLSAKWSGTQGSSGSATGSVKVDANGRATRTEWSNGVVFVRQ